MEVYDCIKQRRSIRKYKDIPVAFDDVWKIIDAGRMAPSSGNLQGWKFIVITDAGKRQKIADACLQQTWMIQAPIFIVIVSEVARVERYYGLRGERLYSCQNCAAAAENMMLMATNLGLGSCWVGAFDEDKVKDMLNIPTGSRPQIIITIGYADEVVPEPAKFPLEAVTYFNKWRSKITNVPRYFGYISNDLQKGAKASSALLQKGGRRISENVKEITNKISERIKKRQKEQRDIEGFEKVREY